MLRAHFSACQMPPHNGRPSADRQFPPVDQTCLVTVCVLASFPFGCYYILYFILMPLHQVLHVGLVGSLRGTLQCPNSSLNALRSRQRLSNASP